MSQHAVVDVFYGPPSKPRLEGQAEVLEVVKYLGDGRYIAKVRFQGDPDVKQREIDIERRQPEK